MVRQTVRPFAYAAIFLFVTFTAYADAWNKKTILKVYETIQVPGAVLEPGTYVIKLIDSLSDRHIVCITNEREDKVYTTILAIPNYRLQPKADTQFSWWEVPAGNPAALRAWFYPGDNFGQEFAYPKGMAATFAGRSHVPVPIITAQKEVDLPTTPLRAVAETGVEQELAVETYKPAPQQKEVAQVVTPAVTPPSAPQPVEEPQRLPATASPFPLLALGGALALFAGMALRLIVTRS